MGLLDGLVSYWKLDEPSAGDDAIDAHGSNDLVDPLVAATSGMGALNGSRGGNNAYIIQQVVTFPTNFLRGTGSFCGWVKLSDTTDSPANITNLQGDDVAVGLCWNDSGSGVWGLIVNNGAVQNLGGSASDNTWVFFGITWDEGANEVKLRIDATTYAGTYSAPSGTNQTVQFGIFGFTTSSEFDEVGLWSRSLSEAELDTLYGSGTPPGYGSFTSSSVALDPTDDLIYHLRTNW